MYLSGDIHIFSRRTAAEARKQCVRIMQTKLTMPYIVYGRESCPYSRKAAELAYIQLLPIEILRNPTPGSFEEHLLSLVKKSHITVPVVFFRARHNSKKVAFVGGCDDMERLMKKRKAAASRKRKANKKKKIRKF